MINSKKDGDNKTDTLIINNIIIRRQARTRLKSMNKSKWRRGSLENEIRVGHGN